MQLIFHIGYHKTATSWLQRSLFIPECGYGPLMTHEEVDQFITRPHPFVFQSAPTAALLEHRQAKQPTSLIPVVSSELLCGQPFFGGREAFMFAERIHQIAPNAKIVMTVRPQQEILTSIYMQFVRRGGQAAPRHFFKPNEPLGYHAFDPTFLEYDRLVECYDRLFGTGNVLVLNQRTLAKDRARFVGQLGQFSGLPDARITVPHDNASGVSDREQIVPVTRRLNYFRRDALNPYPILNLGFASRFTIRAFGKLSRSNWFRACFRGYEPVSSVVRSAFNERYLDSNSRLAQLRPNLELDGFLLGKQ